MVADLSPITAIGVVADKKKCPQNFKPIVCAHDDASCQADVWKDGFFSFTAVYRYVVYSKHIDQTVKNCHDVTPVNVVADLSIINENDLIPPGFVAVETTLDTREKALRKKQLCVRVMPLETAVDAVCDVVILARTKHAPAGYTIAGDVDGLLICFKYSTIPKEILDRAKAHASSSSTESAAAYPNLSYHGAVPHHPNAVAPPQNGVDPARPGNYTMTRQLSQRAATGIDGVPFQLNPLLKPALDRHRGVDRQSSLSSSGVQLKPVDRDRLERDFSYDFIIEQRCLENMLLSQN